MKCYFRQALKYPSQFLCAIRAIIARIIKNCSHERITRLAHVERLTCLYILQGCERTGERLEVGAYLKTTILFTIHLHRWQELMAETKVELHLIFRLMEDEIYLVTDGSQSLHILFLAKATDV